MFLYLEYNYKPNTWYLNKISISCLSLMLVFVVTVYRLFYITEATLLTMREFTRFADITHVKLKNINLMLPILLHAKCNELETLPTSYGRIVGVSGGEGNPLMT